MKLIKFIFAFFILVCLLDVSLAVNIVGGMKSSEATPINVSVYYKDIVEGKIDYKYYKLNIDKPSKVIFKMSIEPGTHSQGADFLFFLGDKEVRKGEFTGNTVWETEFETVFNAKEPGEYILKIFRHDSWFIGEYGFRVILDCIDKEFNDSLERKCVDREWVLKDAIVEDVKIKEPVENESQKVVVENVSINGTNLNDSNVEEKSLFGRIIDFFKQLFE